MCDFFSLLLAYNYRSTVRKSYSTYVVNCKGNETSLDDCDVTYYSQTRCRMVYNITCQNCKYYNLHCKVVL